MLKFIILFFFFYPYYNYNIPNYYPYYNVPFFPPGPIIPFRGLIAPRPGDFVPPYTRHIVPDSFWSKDYKGPR